MRSGWDGNCRPKRSFIARRMERSTVRGSGAIPGARKRRARPGETSISNRGIPRRWERIPRAQVPLACTILSGTVGVDADGVRAVSGVYADAVLSRVFRKFFRRQALRYEGWLAAHRGVHAAAVVPKLVPASLSVRLRNVPLRRGLRVFSR